MFPNTLNLTSLHDNKKKSYFKTNKIVNKARITDFNVNDDDSGSVNYSHENKNSLIDGTNEKEKTEFEIKLPKIYINDVKRNGENGSTYAETLKSFNSNTNTNNISLPDFKNRVFPTEGADSDYIDYYTSFRLLRYPDQNKININKLISTMENLEKKNTMNKKIYSLTLESDFEYPKKSDTKMPKKVKHKIKYDFADFQKTLSSRKDALLASNESNNNNTSKVSYNNLSLMCKDESKVKDLTNPFRTKLKPLSRNSLQRCANKTDSRELEQRKKNADVEFYLSSQNNAFNNRNMANGEKIFNKKLRNYLNQRQMMYLKYKSLPSTDLDSLYNSNKLNFIKQINSISDDKLFNQQNLSFPIDSSQNSSQLSAMLNSRPFD